MGRRKIEIKAIKDDRNRSVTFLKRKGGLFKKAHELSVLCSVDVAVFIFGSNKKLYEYSSCDMREMITRYTYHGGPNEHKGPSDFNGGADDDEEEDDNGTPPHGDGMEAHMLPPHFQGQPSFPHIRHHTPSASPPIQNGVFGSHPVHPIPRGHTPQPQIGSRPSSRNDMRRLPPNMVPQPVGPPGPPPPPTVNGYAYMPQPAIYNPQNPPNMPPNIHHGMSQNGPPFPYPTPPQPHSHQMQAYMEEQRRSLPPNFPPHGQQQQQPPPPPPQQGPPAGRHSVSPPQPPSQQLPPHPALHMSPPPPQAHPHPMQSPPQPQVQPPPQPQAKSEPPPPPHELQPPTVVEPKPEPPSDRPRQALLLDTNVRKLAPQKKQGSIFTPIDENRSILSQHLAAFHSEVPKSEPGANRSQSMDSGPTSRASTVPQPPSLQPPKLRPSVPAVPETTFTPPSRSNSLRVGGPGAGAARPRLKVQIPEEPSDNGSATAESSSPRGNSDTASQSTRRHPSDSHSSGVVLPPPSPSASALLSAGASGPPNPFARPPPHQSNLSIDTPVSALPSRFLNGEFLPSPSSFYPEWNFRGSDSNTLPSPLNFATPVHGTGPSFLRDDPGSHKRKSPDVSATVPAHEGVDAGHEPKRVKIETM